MNFFSEEEKVHKVINGTYKIIIADDDEEVHRVTKVILKFFEFENKTLEFYDAYSGDEAMKMLEVHKDVAIIFLDVVMETEDAGLRVVKHLRETLDNHLTRVILRTGQPGEAPEEEIIRDYDINDYRLKTELTVKRLHTTLYSSLRNYRDLKLLDKNKRGLEKIITASSKLFEHNTLNDFLVTILNELSNFNYNSIEMLYIREDDKMLEDGLVILEEVSQNKIIAGTGKFVDMVNQNVNSIDELKHVQEWIQDHPMTDDLLHDLGTGFIIENRGKSNLNNYIYIDSNKDDLDVQLINLFLSNFSIALDNYILNNVLLSTQKEIVFTLAETVDCHFEETGSHTKRIAEMMYQFAICKRYSYTESEMIRLASTMHDLGKVAIPDDILKKPGSLTDEEFTVMRKHAMYGYNILKVPELPIIRIAAEIARNHHEKFDGTGYPDGKKGLEIPLYARMMAIVDVYDAMTHDRVYKTKSSVEETLTYIREQKGLHFDPELVDMFLKNLDVILENIKKNNIS